VRTKQGLGHGIDVVPVGAGAEGDGVRGGVAAGAGEGGGSIVIRVAIRPWARVLEELRVRRRPARGGARVLAAATVLRRPEREARALARDDIIGVDIGGGRRRCHDDTQVSGARGVEVDQAPRGRAVAGGGGAGRRRRHQQREVGAVHQAHVVEVHAAAAVQRELRQRRRRRRVAAAAGHGARAAVARGACELVGGGVGGAEGAAPQTA